MKGRSRDRIQYSVSAFVWKDRGKPWKTLIKIIGVPAKIRTRIFQNKKCAPALANLHSAKTTLNNVLGNTERRDRCPFYDIALEGLIKNILTTDSSAEILVYSSSAPAINFVSAYAWNISLFLFYCYVFIEFLNFFFAGIRKIIPSFVKRNTRTYVL